MLQLHPRTTTPKTEQKIHWGLYTQGNKGLRCSQWVAMITDEGKRYGN